jgi:trehalose/maltose hydrolase-like predicted phosphorylase
MVGLQDDAYKWFVQTATCDLSGNSKQFAGKLYIGGTHPASCGGTWLTLYEGFAKNASKLPKQVKSLSISTIKGTKVYGRKDD